MKLSTLKFFVRDIYETLFYISFLCVCISLLDALFYSDASILMFSGICVLCVAGLLLENRKFIKNKGVLFILTSTAIFFACGVYVSVTLQSSGKVRLLSGLTALISFAIFLQYHCKYMKLYGYGDINTRNRLIKTFPRVIRWFLYL